MQSLLRESATFLGEKSVYGWWLLRGLIITPAPLHMNSHTPLSDVSVGTHTNQNWLVGPHTNSLQGRAHTPFREGSVGVWMCIILYKYVHIPGAIP
jgi:hypothetical protein